MWNLVSAQDRVPADLQHLKKHLDSIFNRVDFGALVVGPFYRDLGHAESQALGEEEELGVESPALDALAGEENGGNWAGGRRWIPPPSFFCSGVEAFPQAG